MKLKLLYGFYVSALLILLLLAGLVMWVNG